MEWTPAVLTTALLALALWLGRNLLVTRLVKSVQYEFDTRLEEIRAEARRSEERLGAEIRAREMEISALRSSAISGVAARQVALDKRKLEAADQLWKAAMGLGPGRAISSYMAVINFENAAIEAEKNANFRKVIEIIGSGFDMKTLSSIDALNARLHVSPMAWATYVALLSIVTLAVVRWQVLKGGLAKTDFADEKAINKMLLIALPHQENYINQHGSAGYHFLLEELENKLLQELQRMLAGSESDKNSLEQAAEILKQSKALLSTISTPTPDGLATKPQM